MKRPNIPLLNFWNRHRTIIILVGIVAIGAFFRFYQLSKLPPGLHPDEAANGLDIFRMMEKHDFRPLYNTNGPREALFFYLQAIFVLLMGNTILALRMAPAAIGTLEVITTYLWVKSWFGRRAGLISAFLMAVTPWAVTITRDGFRASMTPLFVTLTLWLYTKAFQTGRRKWFVLAGASLGAGLYTYLAFRLFPFALILLLGFAWFKNRQFIKHWFKPLAISMVATFIMLLPMIAFGIKHPGDIGARAAGTSFLNKDLNHGKPVQTLVDTTVKTMLMFNVHGDENYRQNLGGQPELNVFVGIMFILGLLLSLANIWRARYFALLAVWGTMLLPEVLTAEGIPHALRAIGAVAPTLVLAAIGIGYMLDRWYSTFPINSAARAAGRLAILILLVLTAYQGYSQYFVAWAQSPQTYEAYSEDAVAMANFFNAHSFSGDRYAVIDGYSDKTLYYITHNHSSYRRLDPSDIKSLPLDNKPKQFVIDKGQKDEAIKELKIKFAGGRLSPQYSSFNDAELFDVYEVTK